MSDFMERTKPDNADIFAFMEGMLSASFDLSRKCPKPEFARDIQNNVITPWAQIIKFYRNKLQEKEETKT